MISVLEGLRLRLRQEEEEKKENENEEVLSFWVSYCVDFLIF